MRTKHIRKESTPGYLTQQDTEILKGLGILMIFLHNYFHWLPGLGLENEFVFKQSNVIEYLTHAFASLENFFTYGFAYFGHFGVQIFVMVSGYGLYAAVQKKHTIKFDMGYFIPKLMKIFSLLLVGTVILYVIQYLNTGSFYDYRTGVAILFFRLSSIWNFSFDTIFKYSGPFWFFGLIVQLYLIFPLVAKIIRKSTPAFDIKMLITLLAINIVLYPVLTLLKIPFMGIFIGHLPVFLMGIMLAKYGYRSTPALLFLAIVLFLLGQYFWVLHTVSSIAITYIMVSIYFGIKQHPFTLSTGVPRLMEELGKISMAIFILNGPLRTLALFQDTAGKLIADRVFLFTLILVLASIPLTWAYRATAEILSRPYTWFARYQA